MRAELDSIQAALLQELEDDTRRILAEWYPDDPQYGESLKYDGMDRWRKIAEAVKGHGCSGDVIDREHSVRYRRRRYQA